MGGGSKSRIFVLRNMFMAPKKISKTAPETASRLRQKIQQIARSASTAPLRLRCGTVALYRVVLGPPSGSEWLWCVPSLWGVFLGSGPIDDRATSVLGSGFDNGLLLWFGFGKVGCQGECRERFPSTEYGCGEDRTIIQGSKAHCCGYHVDYPCV